jgi:hypothetical protein
MTGLTDDLEPGPYPDGPGWRRDRRTCIEIRGAIAIECTACGQNKSETVPRCGPCIFGNGRTKADGACPRAPSVAPIDAERRRLPISPSPEKQARPGTNQHQDDRADHQLARNVQRFAGSTSGASLAWRTYRKNKNMTRAPRDSATTTTPRISMGSSGRNVVVMGLTGLACLVGEVLASGLAESQRIPATKKKELQAIRQAWGSTAGCVRGAGDHSESQRR